MQQQTTAPAPGAAPSTPVPLDQVIRVVIAVTGRMQDANKPFLPKADYDTRVERLHRVEAAGELERDLVQALLRRFA